MRQSRRERELAREVRTLRQRVDAAHGERQTRLIDELEEARLGLRLATSNGGRFA